jgi:hypothetical protein
MSSKKKMPANKIVNPETGRWVLRRGAIGQALLANAAAAAAAAEVKSPSLKKKTTTTKKNSPKPSSTKKKNNNKQPSSAIANVVDVEELKGFMADDFDWFKNSRSWYKINNHRMSMLPVSSAFFAQWSKATYNRWVPGRGKEKPARLHWFTESQELMLAITKDDPVLHALVQQHSFTWHGQIMYHHDIGEGRWTYIAEQMLKGLEEAGVTEAQLSKLKY